MSLKKALLEQECGGTNHLVDLSQNFTQNNSKLQNQKNDGVSSLLPSLSKGESFAEEYMGRKSNVIPTNTFDMRSLIGAIPQQHQQPRNNVSILTNSWTNEFLAKPIREDLGQIWNQSFVPSTYLSSQSPSNVSEWVASYVPLKTSFEKIDFSQVPTNNQMWSSEYLEKFDEKSNNLAGDWLNEYMNRVPTESVSSGKMDSPENEAYNTTMDDYENEWEDILYNGLDFSKTSVEKYEFNQNNPFLEDKNPLETAKTLMMNGNISDAILYYEAAVQRTPEDSNVWCSLALCHAENENDGNAIKAFEKSLNLNPSNKEALLGYSVSLSNEFRENEAVENLERWLQVHTNQNVAPFTNEPHYKSSFLNRNKFDIVEKNFLDYVRRNNGPVDVELQNALGILYNIGNNYSRAIDSLKLALSNKPDDPRLWNRLGATLANDDKTTEAISAYRNALNLFPTYVRARYNLGISCMHLNSYEQAIEHLVSALQLQKNQQSSPIWSTLRTAVIRLPKMNSDMMEAIDNKDLNMFMKKM
uniref:GH08708p (inferred by orthology to a D. melanogaster protein) n=1 Tax=Strongyloides venezuelensis TaxID=75913 RepID=A0A0K0EY04_STRVS